MINWLSNINFLKGNSITALSITINDSYDMDIDGCILQKIKNNIKIEKTFNTNSLDTINEFIPKSIPINLHVDGKGILHKSATSENNNLRNLLPNADKEQFYISEHTIQDNNYISIVRKTAIDGIVEKLKQVGFFIHSIEVSPHRTFLLKDFINNFPETICTRRNCYTLKAEESVQISNINDSISDTVNIGEEHLQQHEVLPYLTGIQFYINDFVKGSKNSILPSLNWEDYIFKNLFNYTRWGILIFFFVILLINYFVFDSINRKSMLLESQVQSSKELLFEIKRLTSELELKESIVLESGLSSQTRFSAFCDKIGISIPKNISLTTMQFNPIEEQIREDEEIQISNDILIIEGLARNSLELNEWLKRLREENWIERIDIMNYEHDFNSKFGEFKIRIRINVK